ncbi:hypothetical protein DM860_011412 [Cuscuta australis]|uniref:Uncharacterized protein n=1 Tax=Cuscuta australis TaxID=267555 RepID=A0A328DQ85_9ASTE|nr:hypothetical protein DM860_011412 [Cuscuta australis]
MVCRPFPAEKTNTPYTSNTCTLSFFNLLCPDVVIFAIQSHSTADDSHCIIPQPRIFKPFPTRTPIR